MRGSPDLWPNWCLETIIWIFIKLAETNSKANGWHSSEGVNWIYQLYNIALMGPSGIEKTALAAGLSMDALKAGHKVYFKMDEILNAIQTKDFVKSHIAEYKKLLKAILIVLDDIMLFPLERNLAASFFNFINQVYENTSIIITTNKKPIECA